MEQVGRELILGIGGGISAYKSAELLRRLQDIGFNINVVPTQSSLNFVGSATWEALSGNPVITNLWNNVHTVPHIKMAKKSSALIIAPATADLIAKISGGLADDLLTNIVLATTAPIILVPAMHPEMWSNVATQENVKKLRERGILVIEPDEGRMTGNDFGVGRYPEISRILLEVSDHLQINSELSGKKVVITAGGTREPIDPVRYIGNRSSGKQGIAFAKIALNLGADVTLILANSELSVPKNCKLVRVETALEMQSALDAEFENCDILVMAAAVADARVEKSSTQKLKKDSLDSIKLVSNPDILASLSEKKAKQVIIAFAAEAGADLLTEGRRKLKSKNADLLYVNDVSDGAVFGSDQTSGWILDKDGNSSKFDLSNKDTLAYELLIQARTKLG